MTLVIPDTAEFKSKNEKLKFIRIVLPSMSQI